MVVRSELFRCSPLLSGRVATATVAVLVWFCGNVVAEQQPDAKKAAPAKAAAPAPADSMLQQATEIVAKQVRDGDLRGAWFQIDGKDGVYDVLPLLDKSKAKTQIPAIQRVLADLEAQLPTAKFTLREPVLRPVSELIESLQHEMEASMDFPGVSITAAVFTIQEKTGSVNLLLQGRISTDEQRDEIQSFSMDTMSKHPFWGRRQPSKPTAKEFERAFVDCAQLKNLQPSAVFGSRLFNRGMNLFRNGDVDAARKHFRASMVESAGTLTRHYWLILCELELGQTERARNLLREPMNRIRTGKLSYEAVLWSLEKVQGHLRWKLIALEDSILLEGE